MHLCLIRATLLQTLIGRTHAEAATVKFLYFRTPENFAVIYLKFKQRGQTLRVFRQKEENGMANSEDPDQTAPRGAV